MSVVEYADSAQVEKLLEEVDATAAAGGESAEALGARVRLYERVASEVSRLNYHAAKGAQLPFVQQLRPRIQAATEKLQVPLLAPASYLSLRQRLWKAGGGGGRDAVGAKLR